MELRHLRHFIVLARLKSFSKAANELHLAQPSLSRSIQKMEERLGASLLARDEKHFALTEYGRLVLAQGELIVSQLEYLESEIKTKQGLEKAKLVIGASPIPSNSIIGPAVGRFIRDNPDISLELKVESWSRLYKLLLKGELDMFIAETNATLLDQRDNVITQCLPQSQAIFCCRPHHPLTRLKTVYLPSLRDYPVGMPSAMPQLLRQRFEDLFEEDRHDFVGLVKYAQFQPIKSAIKECDMVVITPDISVREELASGELVALDVVGVPNIKASFSVVSMKNRRLSHSAEQFVDSLLTHSSAKAVGF
ncbi:LysR family transcriptional regulator [Shewanella loihica]|uniref:Transcriptional regulator, LysR family n=1 Tax=Shewanella loihica (strain ATCC BAA-1088 / PV-4) TaxID=323850 RepID=A3QH77_SHELP|nr:MULTISPECIES: LysR family transcriptional regulator [Shewanella]ABO24825.1 transcriptional regulator, LysR family [Shewanella loihica PV-4]QYJ81625.1 LysR family transcriptional regulator [Shewanella aegiceratis]QYJ92978.1 LysR family transcriptional regulator [Shewanella spartinae]